MADITWGSEYTWSVVPDNQALFMQTCKLGTNKFVVAYIHASATSPGRAFVGIVSDSAISYGSEVVFHTIMWQQTGPLDICYLDTDKFIVTYIKYVGGYNEHLYAKVGTVSGDVISFGSEVDVSGAQAKYVSCVALSTTKFAAVYENDASEKGEVCICTVSGSTISVGTPSQFHAGSINDTACCKCGTDKLFITYTGAGLTGPYGKVATISGTVPSWGAAKQIHTVSSRWMAVDYLEDDKLVLIWNAGVLSTAKHGQACILTVSGTTITVGAKVETQAAAASGQGPTYQHVVAASATEFVFVYTWDSYYDHGVSRYCTVSGTTITLGDKETWSSQAIGQKEISLVDSHKVALVFIEGNNGPEKAIIGTWTTTCTVTTEAATDIAEGTATLNGTLTDDGGEARNCSYEYGEAADALDDTTDAESKTTGETFPQAITGLKAATTYYFRAKATSDQGTCYGSTLDFTTLGEVYPSVATTRVTGLIHRWFPGTYTLEMNLGSISTEFGLPSWSQEPEPPIPPDEPSPPPTPELPPWIPAPICISGMAMCFGTDLYRCVNGRWELYESNSAMCGGIGAECTEGATKYIDGVRYICTNGKWVRQTGL